MMRAALATLLALFAWPALATTEIVALDIDGSRAETRLEMRFSDPVPAPTPRFIDKRRVILDFADMGERLQGRPGASGQEVLPGEGVVEQVRWAPRGEGGLRIVLDLASDATVSDAAMRGETYKLVVSAIGEAASADAAREAGLAIPRLKPAAPVQTRPVIVIDPGHGGHDPGAIGQRGTREKDITFAASQQLAKRLQDTGRYEVVLTRDEDVYVAHEGRLRAARLAGADLFISIHADSTATPEAAGASVYTLSDRAVARSKRIVEDQNWILDVDLSDQSDAVGDILVDLAQRKTKTQSAQFADHLLPMLARHSRMVRNSHRRAGYYVLLAPDVPAVLLEMGFLSNATDEANLGSRKHRDRLMQAVMEAIDAYFEAG